MFSEPTWLLVLISWLREEASPWNLGLSGGSNGVTGGG